MIKKYLTSVVAVILLAGGVGVPVSHAQVANAIPAQTAVPGIAQGFTIIPGGTIDPSDEIVQLNNLTLQNTPGFGSDGMLYASYGSAVSCSHFYSQNSFGAPIACPVIGPNVLYQIKVDPTTVLLLRNRQRASLADLNTGDHINVFGFIDAGTNYMQALIVRDLDRPAAQNAQYYTQFNDVRAVTAPGPLVPQVPGGITASFDVVFSQTPCVLYSGPQGYRLPTPCPYYNPAPGYGMLAKHQVNILTGQTVILNQYRQSLSANMIQVGDMLNIFGRYNPQTGTMDALIIRDLSNSGSISSGPVTISGVSGPTSLQVGQQGTWTVQAMSQFGGNLNYSVVWGDEGSYPMAVNGSQGATLSQSATFTHAYMTAGTYRPIFTVTAGNGASAQSSLSVNVGGVFPNGAPQITGVNPQTAAPGASVTLTGTGFSAQGNTVSMIRSDGNYPVTINNLSATTYTGGGSSLIVFQVPQYWGPTCNTGTFCAQYVTVLPAGTYNVTVTNQYGVSNTVTLTVSSGVPITNTLTVIAPNGGEQLVRNQQYAIRWSVPPTTSSQFSSGQTFDIFAVHKTMNGDFVSNVQYPLAKNVFLNFNTSSGAYSWTVGLSQDNSFMADGSNYYIRVCYAGTSNCDESDGAFTISSIGTQNGSVQVYGLQPSQGYPNTTVTLTGNGFLSQNNIVHFEMSNTDTAYIPNLSSSGTTLSFSVPAYSSYACTYSTYPCALPSHVLAPGTYRVWVENLNGSSNALTFTLYNYLL